MRVLIKNTLLTSKQMNLINPLTTNILNFSISLPSSESRRLFAYGGADPFNPGDFHGGGGSSVHYWDYSITQVFQWTTTFADFLTRFVPHYLDWLALNQSNKFNEVAQKVIAQREITPPSKIKAQALQDSIVHTTAWVFPVTLQKTNEQLLFEAVKKTAGQQVAVEKLSNENITNFIAMRSHLPRRRPLRTKI